MRSIALAFLVPVVLVLAACSEAGDNQAPPEPGEAAAPSQPRRPPAPEVVVQPAPVGVPPTPAPAAPSAPSAARGMVRSPQFVTPTASGQVPAPFPPPRPVDARAEYALVRDDLGSAWGLAKSGELDDGFHTRLVLLRGTPPTFDTVVVSWVNLFEDEESASAALKEKAHYWTGGGKYSLPAGDPKLGDESFNYTGHDKFEVYFRTGHVLGRITMYGPWRGSTPLTVTYALQLLSKINEKIGKPPPPAPSS